VRENPANASSADVVGEGGIEDATGVFECSVECRVARQQCDGAEKGALRVTGQG
jgi:hypothetical protein